MSVAAIRQPPTAVYREEQNFGLWAYTLIAFLVVAGSWVAFGNLRANDFPIHIPRKIRALELPVGLALGFALPALLTVSMLRMTTEVALGHMRIWFGWVPIFRREIDLSGVRKLEVVRYRPWLDYGGPGIRIGRDGERILNARGNRGVRLHFADGSRLLIGSQRPEALAAAIEGSIRPAV